MSVRLWLLWILCAPVAAPAQPAESTGEPLFRSVSGAFFALSVADVASSAEWYSEKLGLDVVLRIPAGDGPAVIVLEGGGLVVELVEDERARPIDTLEPGLDARGVHGIFKVGVVVEDFAAVLERLRIRDVEIALGPFPARDGQPANVLIRDNAGNLLQILGEWTGSPP